MNEKDYQKLCLARYIYREGLIDSALPSVSRARQQNPRRKIADKTWRDWWADRFGGEKYDDYLEKMRR